LLAIRSKAKTLGIKLVSIEEKISKQILTPVSSGQQPNQENQNVSAANPRNEIS